MGDYPKNLYFRSFQKLLVIYLVLYVSCSSLQDNRPQQCENRQEIKALIDQASIFFGQSLDLQLNYIKEKISRQQYFQWDLLIVNSKGKFLNYTSLDPTICTFYCQNCNIYQPSLIYRISGISASSLFKGKVYIDSKEQFVGKDLSEMDELVWKNIIQAAQFSKKDFYDMADFIYTKIRQWNTCQIVHIEIFESKTELVEFYLSCFSVCCKPNWVMVHKSLQTTFVIKAI